MFVQKLVIPKKYNKIDFAKIFYVTIYISKKYEFNVLISNNSEFMYVSIEISKKTCWL